MSGFYPIRGEWFRMILSGEKGEEYRDIKPYYTARFRTLGLLDTDGKPTGNEAEIALRRGYSAKDPEITCRVRLRIGYGRREWGAPGKQTYILEILEIKSVRNCRHERGAEHAGC